MCIKCGNDIFCYCGQHNEKTEQNSKLNDGLCPTHVGIDLASGPDRTVMKCSCGWYGEPKDMKANASGIRTCPGCGASGGVVGA